MYLDFAKIPIYALVLKKCLTLIENILYNILGVMYLEEIMFLNNFFEKFSGRLCWNVNFFRSFSYNSDAVYGEICQSRIVYRRECR